MLRSEAIEFINQQTPADFLPAAKRKGYVCPVCQNGTGKSGDGITKNPKTGKYKCFKCNDVGGDIIDLVGYTFGLTDFNDKLQKACSIYGIFIDDNNSISPKATKPAEKQVAEARKSVVSKTETDCTAYFNRCHGNVSQTDYFAKRGITQESIDRFNLGYDPDWSEGTGYKHWKAIIIPTSESTCEARNTEVRPNDPDQSGNKTRKHGKATLFNGRALREEKEKPIFITEGAIDAISIMQCGGVAVSICSTSNPRLLLDELETTIPWKPVILLMDPDSAGERAAATLEEGLKAKNIPYVRADKKLSGHHDPNDFLLQDPEGLKKMVAEAMEEASALPGPGEAALQNYLSTAVSNSIIGFLDRIEKNAARPQLSTGFRTLDDALEGGLYTGLYIMGAISSLGKTTLMLQIADSLAKKEQDVLLFSLEQGKDDLMSKTLSRETFMFCRQNKLDTKMAKSNLGISDGRRWEHYSEQEFGIIMEAAERYYQYGRHLFIYEGLGDISVEDIREKVKQHISVTGNFRPIVFIDYIQILKPVAGDERATDKQVVDHNVTALKQLSRDFDIPVFGISSLNRQNYSEEINMAAFKESGAIEYGSDVLIGLQLAGAGVKDFDVNAAKNQNPRQIEFRVLKNRNGRITKDQGVRLEYYPVFNCFLEPVAQPFRV